MDTVTKIDKKYLITAFVIIISLLTLASFWKSLDFYFWRDDWDLWSQQHYFWKILKVHNHPGTWVSRALLYHVFGWNHVAWQSLGLVLRIVASLVVSLLILGISKSKKTAILAGIFFATSIFGMETLTWSSVYIIPEIIILNCLGFYMWILFVEKKSYKYAVISILLIIFAVLGDPGRASFIIPMIVLWEILNWWISSKRETLSRLLLRVGLFTISLILFMRVFLSTLYSSNISLWDNIKFIVNDLQSFTTLFSSIGNLLLGWLNSPGGGDINQFALPIIIILSFMGFTLGFFKKSRFGMTLLLLTLWIPVMYIPNWLSNKSLVVSPTDRYLAVSAVGYIGILALVLSSIRLRFLSYFLIASFIIFNIKTANEVLDREASYRSYKIVEPLWTKIDQDVPKGEQNSIFTYIGNDPVTLVDLNWSGSLPFGIRRNLTQYEDFPIFTNDNELILKLLCEDNVYRPDMFGWMYQKERIQLSHLHAWEYNGGILENVSIIKREEFKKKAGLNNCILKE